MIDQYKQGSTNSGPSGSLLMMFVDETGVPLGFVLRRVGEALAGVLRVI
jgi:hypothetical protein